MASLLVGLWQFAGLPVAEGASPPRPKPRSTTKTRRRSTPSKKQATRLDEGDLAGLPPGIVGLPEA